MTIEKAIINFLEGKCDAREGAIVYAWLKENPVELEAYLGEGEWEGFQPGQVLLPEISGKLWDGIKKNSSFPAETGSKAGWYAVALRWVAVAALVILVIGLPWHYISDKQKTGILNGASAAMTKRIANNTLSKMTFTLSDGSAVELLPNSTLSYPEDFNAFQRAVILTGGANFNIARDVAKPFSVSSNSILTTALGTRFTVKAYEANNTTVILHEGRVRINIENSSSRENKKEYYLTPGDIFILNRVKVQSRGSGGDPRNEGEPTNEGERRKEGDRTNEGERSKEGDRANDGNRKSDGERVDPPADSLSARVIHIEKDKDDRYLFNNYPLDVVFDQLQIIYNTTIVYDKSALGNRSFIGNIDKKDSLYTILKSIALLNNFRLRKDGDGFIIGPY